MLIEEETQLEKEIIKEQVYAFMPFYLHVEQMPEWERTLILDEEISKPEFINNKDGRIGVKIPYQTEKSIGKTLRQYQAWLKQALGFDVSIFTFYDNAGEPFVLDLCQRY